jgi:hypothetical protein
MFVYAAKAMSWIVFAFEGAPRTKNLPWSNSMSASDASSRYAAIFFALSRSLR